MLTISTVAPGLRPPDHKPATTTQLSVLYLSLYLTALGTGGLKSSVSGFGSDQFDETNPEEKKSMSRFFSWFFFFISLGSLLAVTVLVYIQDNVGREWGYGLCAGSIVVGLMVFLAGTRRYRYKKLAGSPLTQIAAVVAAAWRKRGVELPDDPALLYDDVGEEGKGKGKGKLRLPHTKQFRFLDHAAIKHNPVAKQTKWQLSTLTDVEEVKIIIRMLPIWATTIMFWTVYAQMTTFSVSQATVMNRSITSSFSIPSGSLTVFFVASILLTIPFYDNVILPLLPRPLSSLQRIGLGLSLSCVAMAAAALIELKRLHSQIDHNKQLTVFWLIPQFFFVGSGEALAYVGQLDFFLRECPKGMKTMSTGLFLSTLSLGFFLSSGLVSVVNRVTDWLANDLNEGRLDKFYWLLTALCLLNLGVYLVAAKWYVYKEGRAAAAVEDDSVVGIELKEAEALYGA